MLRNVADPFDAGGFEFRILNGSCVASYPHIPTGFHPKAQGCRAAATLGIGGKIQYTPTGLRPAWSADPGRGHNPVGVDDCGACYSRVGGIRQPWAVGWNRVAVKEEPFDAGVLVARIAGEREF